jgi:hypothetical protein
MYEMQKYSMTLLKSLISNILNSLYILYYIFALKKKVIYETQNNIIIGDIDAQECHSSNNINIIKLSWHVFS